MSASKGPSPGGAPYDAFQELKRWSPAVCPGHGIQSPVQSRSSSGTAGTAEHDLILKYSEGDSTAPHAFGLLCRDAATKLEVQYYLLGVGFFDVFGLLRRGILPAASRSFPACELNCRYAELPHIRATGRLTVERQRLVQVDLRPQACHKGKPM